MRAMKRKASEDALKKAMKYYGFNPQKGRDRGYVNCPRCHSIIKTCPECKEDMLLPKAQKKLDFTILIDWVEVECKQGEETWSLSDLTPSQEELFPETTILGEPRWLFLLMGTGRAPKGKEAYLIPAPDFLAIRQEEYNDNRKSVRYRASARSRVKEARVAFESYELEWEPIIGWTIPDDHTFWIIKQAIRPQVVVEDPKVKQIDIDVKTDVNMEVEMEGKLDEPEKKRPPAPARLSFEG